MVKQVRITRNHKLAIEFRYQGLKYEKISSQVGISTKTLYKYFARGGMLDEAYREYELQMNEEALRAARGRLRRTSRKAAEVMVQLLAQTRKNPTLAFKAAAYILDTSGIGKPLQSTNDEVDMAEEVMKALELGKEIGLKKAANSTQKA